MEVRESQNNLGRAGTYGRGGDEEGGSGRRQVTGAQQAIRKEQRSRYQFEASHSDDEIEDELDDNLGEIGDATKRLKALGLAMGQELDTQNQRIDRISEKATSLDNRMFRNTERVGSFTLAVSSLCLSPLAAQAYQVIQLFVVFRLLVYQIFRRAFHRRGQMVTTKDSVYLASVLLCTI